MKNEQTANPHQQSVQKFLIQIYYPISGNDAASDDAASDDAALGDDASEDDGYDAVVST